MTPTPTPTPNETTKDERSAISFVAFCVEGGQQKGNDPCPEGESLLVKFEWDKTTNTFVPEGGDPKGVTVTATKFKDNDPSEPVEATWTSSQTISTVVVKSGGDTCTYSGGTSGTVESCPVSGGSSALGQMSWFFPAIAVPLGVLVTIRRWR